MKRSILFVILIFLWLIGGLFSAGEAAPFPSDFEDSAVFKVFVKGTEVGIVHSSLDKKGNYRRRLVVSLSGQKAEMSMTANPGPDGEWRTIKIENPALGVIEAERKDREACYKDKGKPVSVILPDGYILYDDYGFLYESVMLKAYDMKRGGRQTFKRFRIPETFPRNLIDTEVEFLRRETRRIAGKNHEFRVFDVKSLGISSEYWADEEGRLYMTQSKGIDAVGVRQGFEALMEVKETDPLLSLPDFEVDVRLFKIPMRDGVKLATDVYFPRNSKEKVPVILIRTPYKKEGSELDGKYYASRGYAVAIQDVRGRYSSPGKWEPFVNEAEDGYDTIEWLASREWSNGKIGMVGGSYLGWVQLQAAAL